MYYINKIFTYRLRKVWVNESERKMKMFTDDDHENDEKRLKRKWDAKNFRNKKKKKAEKNRKEWKWKWYENDHKT